MRRRYYRLGLLTLLMQMRMGWKRRQSRRATTRRPGVWA